MTDTSGIVPKLSEGVLQRKSGGTFACLVGARTRPSRGIRSFETTER
jgi:hypothetical protein